MNYQRIYDELIQRAVARGTVEGYSERHHILPRCLGGGNDASNLVRLTAREHIISHALLARMHPQNHKLVTAAFAMTSDGWKSGVGARLHSRIAAGLRERSAQMLSENHPLHNAVTAAKHREAVREHWANPANLARHREVCNRPEVRAATSARLKDLAAQGLHPMQNPVNAARASAALREACSTPAARAAKSARAKERFTDPVQRATLSAAQIAACDARYAAAGKTRPIIRLPKPDTMAHTVWSICDKMTAELGRPVTSGELHPAVIAQGINANNVYPERGAWFRFHYIQNNQMQAAA